MRRKLPAILLLGSLSLSTPLSGCAAVLSRGPSQLNVSVEDPQENVEVHLDGLSNDHHIRRKVPFFTVSLDRHSDYKLSVRGRGYHAYETRIGRAVQPHVLGDLLLLGLGTYGMSHAIQNPGATIAPLGGIPVMSLGAGLATVGLFGLGWGTVTGSLWRHTPSDVTVSLKQEAPRPFWPFW
ncbi:hypothetical protein D3C86_368850 [compost metagenome]